MVTVNAAAGTVTETRIVAAAVAALVFAWTATVHAQTALASPPAVAREEILSRHLHLLIPQEPTPEGILAAEPAVRPFVLALRWLARPIERDGLVEAVLTSDLARLSPAAVRGMLRSVRAQGGPAEAALGCREGLTPQECAALDALGSTLAAADAVAGSSVSKAFELLWKDLA